MYEGKFFDNFGNLADKREEGKIHHKLIDILFIVVTAVICGCNEWKEIHLWATAEMNITWLKKYIELPYGIPSLSTIGRLFNIIDPKHFEKTFISWMNAVVVMPEKDIVPIDGKTMRGSRDKDKAGAHIVSALCTSHNLVLGQVKTEDKSNEITAIPELLDMLYVKGCIITIDAMGAQKKIAEKIVKDNEADYVLSLKGNQETLHREVEEYFEDLEKEGVLDEVKSKDNLKNVEYEAGKGILGILKTVEKGHGRIEKRTYYYSTDIDWMINARKDWKKLIGIGMVERKVEYISDGKITYERAFHIASIDNINDYARSVRSHWQIESMHWSLDVILKDDENKTKKGTAPQNMAVLKRIAFNAVKNDTQKHPKQSMKGKRFIAQMDLKYRDFLLDLNFREG